MWNPSKLVVTGGSALLLVAACGTSAVAVEAQNTPDLRADIHAVRAAVAVVDGKVDDSNLMCEAVRPAIGSLAEKVDRSSVDLLAMRAELRKIREELELVVEADTTSCASGAVQCATRSVPSSLNQTPIEVRLFVMQDHAAVTDLDIGNFHVSAAFAPEASSTVTTCAIGEAGCGMGYYFVNRRNGGYQIWVHPPQDNWATGTYSLLLRVTDTEGRTVTKLVNVTIPQGLRDPNDPIISLPPGSAVDRSEPSVDASQN